MIDMQEGLMAQERHEALAETLRGRGERLTPQRLLVLEALQSDRGHQTAEAIYERVRAAYPYINIATVYRSLTWLKDQGLIAETDLGQGQTEYESLGEQRHHHLICLHCGRQQEFAHELVAPLAAALRQRYQFAPRLDHLAVFGLCHGCQEGGTGANAPASDTESAH